MFTSRQIACFGPLAFAAMAIAACGSDQTETGPSASVEKFADSNCGICVKDRCAAAIAACQTDPGCTSYLGCLYDCPTDEQHLVDKACDQACSPQTLSETTKTQAELMACRLYGDATACEGCGTPAFPLQSGNPQQCEPRAEPAPTPCRQCYWDKCCDTWDACYASGVNPDCDALGTCVQQCSPATEACVEACFTAHPGSLDTLFAQNACAAEFCAFDTNNCDPAERDACSVCLFDTCSATWVELMSQPDGFLLFVCMGDCEGAPDAPACVEACFGSHPEAEAAGFLWAECQLHNCETVC